MAALHGLARIAVQPLSPLALALRGVARQLAPVLYSVAVGDRGGVWGPFVDFPPRLQERILAVLRLAGTLTPALRRALGVVARCSCVSPRVRGQSAEALVSLALSQRLAHGDADDPGDGGAGSAAPRLLQCLDGVSAAVSLCTGRGVDVGEAGDLTVAPFAPAEAGDLTVSAPADAATAASGWGWDLEGLCGGDRPAYDATLGYLGLASASIARACGGQAVWGALDAVVVQMAPRSRPHSATLPTAREASLVLALHRFASAVSLQTLATSPPQLSAAPTFRVRLLASVTWLLVRGGDDGGAVDVPTERLLGESDGLVALWLEYAAAQLAAERVRRETAGSVEDSCGVTGVASADSDDLALEARTVLRALKSILSTQRLLLAWREPSHATVSIAIAGVAGAARALSSARPELRDATIVASLCSWSGLIPAPRTPSA